MSDQFDVEPPQPTASLWGNMLGLGPIFKLINDPQLGANAHKAVQAIIEGHARMARMEEKLDLLLGVLGHAVDGADRGRITALLARVPDGAGTNAVAGLALDDGSGGAALDPDAAGAAPGRDGGGDRTICGPVPNGDGRGAD